VLAFFPDTNDKYMHLWSRAGLLLPVVFAFSPIWSQTKPPSSATTDYAQEAAVLEETVTKLAFQNSGDHTREQTSRVRIQSDAGVKNWGLLSFPYQSATQIVEVDYVRVRKPDGTTIVTPADNIQDLDSDITLAAPFYSDLREKHVAVKGLGKALGCYQYSGCSLVVLDPISVRPVN
jgi:hypothetical protein